MHIWLVPWTDTIVVLSTVFPNLYNPKKIPLVFFTYFYKHVIEKHKIDINVTKRSKPNFLINFKFATFAMIIFCLCFHHYSLCYGNKEAAEITMENIAKVFIS